MFIYKITNQINNKSYIGYNSSDNDTRWGDHKRDYLKEEYSAKLLYRSMNKYGINNFVYERIEVEIKDLSILKEREIFWIVEYKSFGKLGYNMTKGGDGGCGNQSFLDSATEEELTEYSKKISKSKKEFFADCKKREEWSRRSIELNTAQFMIAGRTIGRKKWWASLTDEERFNYQSERAKGWWNKISVEKKTELSKLRSKNSNEAQAKITPDERKKRVENQRDKISGKYKITCPDGSIVVTNRLKDLCKSGVLKISYNSLKISEKEKKPLKSGWQCERMENN